MLETERLCLRPLRKEDATQILALRSDPRVLEFIDIKKANTIEDALAFIDMIDKIIADNKGMLWGICLKEDDIVTGTIGIWNIVEEKRQAEIGYMLHPGYQGKGLMQEALAAALKYAFNTMQLQTIEAMFIPANVRSKKLLEKMNFTYTGDSDNLLVYTLNKTTRVDP